MIIRNKSFRLNEGFTSNSEGIKQLKKTDFEQVVMRKKGKLKQVELIEMILTLARKEKLELANILQVVKERVKEAQRPGKLSRSISQEALLQVEIICRAVVTQCLRKYSVGVSQWPTGMFLLSG